MPRYLESRQLALLSQEPACIPIDRDEQLPLPGFLITEQAQGLPLAGSRLILQVFDDRKQRIPIRPHHKQSLKRLRVILNLAIDTLGKQPGVIQELQPLALPCDRLNPHAPSDDEEYAACSTQYTGFGLRIGSLPTVYCLLSTSARIPVCCILYAVYRSLSPSPHRSCAAPSGRETGERKAEARTGQWQLVTGHSRPLAAELVWCLSFQ